MQLQPISRFPEYTEEDTYKLEKAEKTNRKLVRVN